MFFSYFRNKSLKHLCMHVFTAETLNEWSYLIRNTISIKSYFEIEMFYCVNLKILENWFVKHLVITVLCLFLFINSKFNLPLCCLWECF
jgi:hypothetical protein